MRAQEIFEGGWASTVTQSTEITPDVISRVLDVVQVFVREWNEWLERNAHPPVQIGHPVGSSAYYREDDPQTTYGDIDLQMIAPDDPDRTQTQIARQYNQLADQFIRETKPSYVYNTGSDSGGHIIFATGNEYVQVDFVWTTAPFSDWARYRSTPEQGLKGVIYGSLYSTLAEMLNLSIQSAGVQAKMVGGEPAQFSRTRKYDQMLTVSKDIRRFGLDILEWVHENAGGGKLKVDPELNRHPGLDPSNIQASDLMSMIRGLAKSFEQNDLFRRYNLKNYENANDFIGKFIELFDQKMEKAATASKFQKAQSPEAREKAEKSKARIRGGSDLVRQYMLR